MSWEARRKAWNEGEVPGMRRLEKVLLPAMTVVMLLLAVPYLLVKTGAWEPVASVGSDVSTSPPIRDPDDLPIIGTLADFSMTDQSGRTIHRSDLLGQVWVADVIFTRCPGPCAAMTARMADLQASLPPDWPVRLVSLTTDPDYDTPDVLHRYATSCGADADRWHFLHAVKPAIVDLAVGDLKLVVLDKEEARESANDLFIHSTTLALVDTHGRLRGAFESLPLDVSKFAGLEHIEPPPPDSWQTTLKPRLLRAVERLVAED
jgi:cytochrome oxidase Cu insertion factor (SCO1/SenC/PrrC family)